jgi:F-type H+-transporting ATPase subunit b
VLTAVVVSSGSAVEVVLPEDLVLSAEEEEVPQNDLNPIAPELKEMAWGFGAFVVFAIALRFWLYPKLRAGMRDRYEGIQADRERAESLTASARADVAEYEARLASVRVEAQQKVDAARQTLEAERTERLAEANERIAQRRAAATADVEAARASAMDEVESAVVDVVGSAVPMATGRSVDPDAVRSAVRAAMSAEATR